MAQPDQMPRARARTQRRSPDQVSGGVLMAAKSHVYLEVNHCHDCGAPIAHEDRFCDECKRKMEYGDDLVSLYQDGK